MLKKLFNGIDFFAFEPKRELFPRVSDREFWDAFAEKYCEKLEEARKEIEEVPRPLLTATLYLQFYREGNRSNYDKAYNRLRTELVNKALLACCYNDGSYIDEVVDLAWMFLEMTSWTCSAHNQYVKAADKGLPDFERHSLSICLTTTAACMAFVYQALGEKLDEISTVINRRIKKRIYDDVIRDFLERDDYWWMGFGTRKPNNIGTWCNRNILLCALVFTEDMDIFRKVIFKAACCLDNYIDNVSEDGYCNEGPSYWFHAVGCLIEAITFLNLSTNNAFVSVWEEQKIQNMTRYLMTAYAGGDYFVNYGDAGGVLKATAPTIFSLAKLAGRPEVCSFAAFLHKRTGQNVNYVSADPYRLLNALNDLPKMADFSVEQKDTVLEYYMPSCHMLTAKSFYEPDKGLFLAAKGGHNKQSHNHNDVGSFMVYKNGHRFLIDSGNKTYSKATFSGDRYTIWTNQSQYHNLPIINGKGQKKGREYEATHVVYEKHEDKLTLSMELKEAYENREEIQSWLRTIEFDRTAQQVTVTEAFAFAESFDFQINLMAPQKAACENGVITLTEPDGEQLTITLTELSGCEPAQLSFGVEEIMDDDATLLNNWGGHLYRICLKGKGVCGKIKYVIQ